MWRDQGFVLYLVMMLLVTACSMVNVGDGGNQQATPTTVSLPTPEERQTPEPVELFLSLSEAKSPQEVESISSFRKQMEFKVSGEAFAEDVDVGSGEVVVDMLSVKEPPGQYLVMNLGSFGDMAFIEVGGEEYANLEGEWERSPFSSIPYFVDPFTAQIDQWRDRIDELSVVGNEMLNGYEAIHLQADKETLATWGMTEQESSPLRLSEGQLDLWLEKNEGFIIKMQVMAIGAGLNEHNPALEGSIAISLEYSDFNVAATINLPQPKDEVALPISTTKGGVPSPSPLESAPPNASRVQITPKEVDSIHRYRLRLELHPEGEAFFVSRTLRKTYKTVIEGEVIKEPLAYHLRTSIARPNEIESLVINGQAYMALGGEWIAVGKANNNLLTIESKVQAYHLEELGQQVDQLERVGIENINGYETILYRAGKETLARLQINEEGLNFAAVDDGELQMWVAQDEHFMVKVYLRLSGTGINPEHPNLAGESTLSLEHYDFNQELVISTPNVAPLLLPPASDLETLLGFDLELPEDALVFTVEGFTLIESSLTVDEAATLFKETMREQGYILNEQESRPADGLYYFDFSERTAQIGISKTQSGSQITISVFTVQRQE